MLNLIIRHWRLYVIRGILTIAFGLMALFWPAITVRVLVFLFGIYVIVQAILAFVAAFANRMEKAWWILLLEGVAGLGVGIIAFIWPGLTAVVLLVLIAVWAILTGILEIGAAIQLRKELKGEWVLTLIGVISVLIGLILIINPGVGLLAVVWLIGVYAIIYGALLSYLGIKARKLKVP